MDKSLLMFRAGVRSVVKTLADGNEHTLYYRARTPNELAAHFGAESAFTQDADGNVARQKHRARFIAAALCDEAGEPLMTPAEAENITGQLKAEICAFIVEGSNQPGEAGKG